MSESRVHTNSVFRFYWSFVKRNKWGFLGMQIGGAFWALLEALLPYISNLLIDSLNGKEAFLSPIGLAVLFIGVSAFHMIGDRIYDLYGEGYLMPRVKKQIRLHTFSFILGHSFKYFQKELLGSLSQRLESLARCFTYIYYATEFSILPITWTFLFSTIIMFTVLPTAGWIFIVWYLFTVSVTSIMARWSNPKVQAHAEAENTLSGQILNVIQNVLAVKTFWRHKYENKYISKYHDIELEKAKNREWALFYTKMVMTFSIILLLSIMLALSIYKFNRNEITIGNVIFIISTSYSMSRHVWWLAHMVVQLFREAGVAKQALTLFETMHDVSEDKNAIELVVKQPSIRFNDVSFSHNDKDLLFQHLNVNIKAYEKVGLVGYSGSGKSTFVNLVQRFYDPSRGEIYIDNTSIQKATLKSVSENIAFIPQEPYLFNRTISDNISYGFSDATQEEIEEAAQKAHVHDFIMSLPDRYETLISERGSNLSLGQRQRLIIARAFLKDAPILIMDEATSALDTATETMIQKSLDALMKKRTTLVIAHRLSTVAELDRILVFDRGEVIEEGHHTELLKKKGLYERLWKMQLKQGVEDAPDM